MSDNNKNQIDSILSFVAGRNPPSESSLRERGTFSQLFRILEASSWLLMATDLLPFPSAPLGMPDNESHGSKHFYTFLYTDAVYPGYMEWNHHNSFDDPLDSSFSIPLPDPSYNSQSINQNSGQTISSDTLSYPIINRDSVEIPNELPLPDPTFQNMELTSDDPTFTPSLPSTYSLPPPIQPSTIPKPSMCCFIFSP